MYVGAPVGLAIGRRGGVGGGSSGEQGQLTKYMGRIQQRQINELNNNGTVKLNVIRTQNRKFYFRLLLLNNFAIARPHAYVCMCRRASHQFETPLPLPLYLGERESVFVRCDVYTSVDVEWCALYLMTAPRCAGLAGAVALSFSASIS